MKTTIQSQSETALPSKYKAFRISLMLNLCLWLLGASLCQAIDIPSLSWTPRSDWVDVTQAPYNADKTGVGDSTAAIQAALNATYGKYTQATIRGVYLPAGTYKISDTLKWKGAVGGLFVGCGKDSKILWAGASGKAMFWSAGNTYCRFVGIAWDGANLAGCAYLHMSEALYETRTRHENESFKNFTVPGTYISGATMPAAAIISGINYAVAPTAETMIWNCLFSNCQNGVVVGYPRYNDYNWIFDGCQFENCGVGIYSQNGQASIFNTHFSNSTQMDIQGNNITRVRRCSSTGSNSFFSGPFIGGPVRSVIQDCWIDSWTFANSLGSITSPIAFGDTGPDTVFDCIFTNPPNTTTPLIQYTNGNYQLSLVLSNNYCPQPNPMYAFNDTRVTNVPSGGRASTLTSGAQTFLKTTWPADSANILDVTKPPYNADRNAATDSSAAIQQAITDARTANNGSIVYIPVGIYRINTTLNVSGGNYAIQGSGYHTQLLWYGSSAAGPIISVTTPQNIAVSQLVLKGMEESCVALVETSTGASSLTLDGVTSFKFPANGQWSGSDATNGPGVVLSGLPTGSLVNIGNLNAPLTVHDCGPATILAKYATGGQVTVNGTAAKTGFFGIVFSQNVQSSTPSAYDLTVGDNQDLVIGDYYNEQSYNNLNLQRGSSTGTGRVTIHGHKQHTLNFCTQINVNNYAGRLFYGGQNFQNQQESSPVQITQSGSNAIDMILLGNSYVTFAPTITLGLGGRLIQANGLWRTIGGAPNYLADILPAGAPASMAAGFDHLRQLGACDLSVNFGLFQDVYNPSYEPSFAADNVTPTNTANPSPLTTLGYQPSHWMQSAAYSTSNGLRQATVVSSGSPFGPGVQCVNLVDRTLSSSGVRQDFWQSVSPAMPANTGGVFTFDFKVKPGAGGGANHWFRVFAANSTCCSVGLSSNGSTASLSSGAGTLNSNLQVGTWYRVRIVMNAPGAGPSSAELWLTPWTASGPGTSISYAIPGISSASSYGFSKIYINQASAGSGTDFCLDNISLRNGDFVFP